MNVVYILWLRQLKRSARSRSRIIGSFAQPLLFLLAFGFGFGSMFQRAGQGNYIQFLAPGVITMSILFTSIFAGIEVIWDRQFGFLKETLVAPVPRILIMVGRTLGGATVAVLQGIVVFCICLIVGFHPVAPVATLGVHFYDSYGGLFHRGGYGPGFGAARFPGLPIGNALSCDADLFPLRSPVSAQRTSRGRCVSSLTSIRFLIASTGSALRSSDDHFGILFDLVVLCAMTTAALAVGGYLFSRIQL